jgi:hypothetical protein
VLSAPTFGGRRAGASPVVWRRDKVAVDNQEIGRRRRLFSLGDGGLGVSGSPPNVGGKPAGS